MRNTDVVQEDLVELCGVRDLTQRTNGDPFAGHIQQEVGQAEVFWLAGVRPRQQKAALGSMGLGGPHFLTGDDPRVAFAHSACRQAGKVRASPRLTEQLTPRLRSSERGS